MFLLDLPLSFPLLFFQSIPPIAIILELTTPSTFYIQEFGSCDEQTNCSAPLGTKSPLITTKHGQPHGCRTIGCCGTNGILHAIGHDKRSKVVGTRG